MSGYRKKANIEEKVELSEELTGEETLREDMHMSAKDDFDYSIHCERAQVADHLEILARSFRDGQVKIATGDKSILLTPASMVKLELTAETKPEKGKGELKIKVSWKEKDIVKPISINPTA
ncbi:MAG: amphi-Trp domain-containing protein [Dehalococcoidales bacterium]|nr:amphi-Trp domain-containing protein [Dehalococcoidales bacterium]